MWFPQFLSGRNSGVERREIEGPFQFFYWLCQEEVHKEDEEGLKKEEEEK